MRSRIMGAVLAALVGLVMAMLAVPGVGPMEAKPLDPSGPVVRLDSPGGVPLFLVDSDDPDFEAQVQAIVNQQEAVHGRAPAGCADYMDRPSHLFTEGSKDVFTRGHIAYRRCLPSYDNTAYAFVKVNYFIGAYNADGASMTCNTVTRYLNGVTFDMRFFQPYRGTSFNPGGFSVTCDETTINSELQNYTWEEQPRLYYGPGSGSDRQPQWTINVKINRRANTDLNWQKTQDFNPYS